MNEASSLTPPNFLGIPEEAADLDRSRFVVLPVPYEATTSYKKGTRLGPQALIKASHQVELFDEELWFESWKAGIHTAPAVPVPQDPAEFMKSTADIVESYVRRGKFVISLGGEHALTEGPLWGVTRVVKDVDVFHMDAHCDLRDEYEGTVYNHACAARRMMEYARKIVQVGIRSVAESEYHTCNSKQVVTFLRQKHRDVGKLIPRVLDELGERVYISIDLDGLDPSVIPGVGTPVPGGLDWYETLDLLRAVIVHKNVVAMDVVELCPLRDTVISEFAAAKLVYRVIGHQVAKEQGRFRAEAEKAKTPRRGVASRKR